MDRCSIDELIDGIRSRYSRVAPADLAAEADAGALVVDIRPIDQRERDGALPGAIVIPRNELEWRLDPASPDRLEQRAEYRRVVGATTGYDRRIVLVCNEGYQSTLAVGTLLDLGLDAATDLADGFQGWSARCRAVPSSPDRD